MSALFLRALVRIGAWQCSRGNHGPLDWQRGGKRQIRIENQAMEMLLAAGFLDLCKWLGTCQRCGRLVAWMSDGPKPSGDWP